MMAIRTVNALSHYTDWTIGHVHSGALGWVAMISIGALYYMIPRVLEKKEMYSKGLINLHFWMCTIGVVVYVIAMWVSGITQGLMWRAVTDDGSLAFTFSETVAAMHPYYVTRLVGGFIFFSGMIVMAYNFIMTAKAGERRAV